MNFFEDWLNFLKTSYLRCGFIVVFIVMQWLIIEPFNNASVIFVFTMSLAGILATKIIYDKEIEIDTLKKRLGQDTSMNINISDNVEK